MAATPGAHEATSDDGLDTLTSDGAIIRIRQARHADAEQLTALHERASDEMLYRRFLSTGHGGIAAEVNRLTRPPDDKHVALVAIEGRRIIGTASYEMIPDHSRAEFAIFVDDAAHDRGIGTLLLEHLAVHARRRGIADLYGEVLPSNSAMLRVAGNLGRRTRTGWDTGLVDVHLATIEDSGVAIDERDLSAARRSLRPLLEPACVAVVGAGRTGGVGHAVLRAIVDGGYTGKVYAVNPAASHVAGVPSYPNVSALPTRPDLVVVVVPAAKVPAVIADAATAGVRAALVISSGFSEEGPDGRARQAELVRLARAAGMRLVGPNCLGILNTDPAVRLHATFAAEAPAGGLALASQSGAVGISVLAEATRSGLGVASFVSLGNKADVSGNDLLAYWHGDPAAKVIALYLESLGNPRRFARIARAVARKKPVLAVKSGRTAAGSRAGASHTAAAAAPDATIDALFAQAGVVRCEGLGDLIDTARMLVDQPLPQGRRIAVIGNAGGVNVLCADAADAAGLQLPALPAAAMAAIRDAAPAATAASNPIDLGAVASVDALSSAIRAAADHVDAIVVAFGATLASDIPQILSGISTAIDHVELPVAVVLLGVSDAPHSLGTRKAPVFTLPEKAIGALARTVRYALWRTAPAGRRPALDDVDPPAARRAVAELLREPHDTARHSGWLSASAAAGILDAYGIHTTPTLVAADEQAALRAATVVDYPVVVKSANPQLVHKSDVGGVSLNLGDPKAVAAAYRAVTAASGDPSVVIQHQAPEGVELVAGIAHDPLFGSVVMCGLGGVYTEVLGDRALRLLPVTDTDAAAMWRSLRSAPLLTGYRGARPTDTAAFENLLLRLGRLAEDLPEVAELDLNPIIVHPTGLSIVDVKLRLGPIGNEPDRSLRALREPS